MVKTPIFAINRDIKSRFRCRQWGNRYKGFTLIELLVVIAIAAMLVAVVPSSLEKLRESAQYRDTVRAIVVDLRQARQQAITYGQIVVFRMDLTGRQFGIQGAPFKKLPPSLEVQTTVGAIGSTDTSFQAEILFMPEGGSTGGTIELRRPSGSGLRIRVDWLFGKVTQEPQQP